MELRRIFTYFSQFPIQRNYDAISVPASGSSSIFLNCLHVLAELALRFRLLLKIGNITLVSMADGRKLLASRFLQKAEMGKSIATHACGGARPPGAFEYQGC